MRKYMLLWMAVMAENAVMGEKDKAWNEGGKQQFKPQNKCRHGQTWTVTSVKEPVKEDRSNLDLISFIFALKLVFCLPSQANF